MAHRNRDTPSKFRCSKKKAAEDPVVTGPNMDSLGFQAMDSNIPGLSQVILRKLNMKSYDEYKCQNVYYCSPECQRANWPVHKKFCKKLKLVALDRLVEWLIFTGDIPFPTETWTKRIQEVKGWEDWFAMQEHLDEKLGAVLTGRYMTILWANAGKPKPEEGELLESIKRLISDFQSRPITIGLGLHAFSIDPYAKPITVHVAGASHIETFNTRVIDYDELTQIFPGHQGIEVVMVGVDVVDGSIMRPPLTAFGPRGRVYLSSYKGLYHDFWESQVETQQAARPDLVVGFHPGFHACQDLMEGWLPTLLLLRDYKIPTLFTMYNEQELKSSLKILMELETNITGCGANPFASLKPEQVYSCPNKPLVYCSSHYIMFHGLSSPPYEPDIGELEEEEDKGE